MTGYAETFRGDVATWEVDATEHFTVAYYFQKFEAASWRYLRLNGIDPAEVRTKAILTRYKAELRNRDIYRIETASITVDGAPVIAHKLYNVATGTLCTTMQQAVVGAGLPEAVTWDGDPWEKRVVPGGATGWVSSCIDVARPEEADWSGSLSLPGYIHRFSTANSFIMSAFGMTPAYQSEARTGLSTFELDLVFHATARPGDMLNIESCIAHLGGSSMRFYHRMRDAGSGAVIAGLSQFGVQLDLDARKPSRIAKTLRDRAEALVARA